VAIILLYVVIQIKLFDLRLTQKGGIQSYEGHVNSHTHLPLVIDPSETLVMSGLLILILDFIFNLFLPYIAMMPFFVEIAH
jgi:hypothetical protein